LNQKLTFLIPPSQTQATPLLQCVMRRTRGGYYAIPGYH
jgi:hypothetical protein